jgi:two-component system chemotaxis response regulator CheY
MVTKILITDNVSNFRAQLRGILIENQYAVYEARNDQEAIDKFMHHKPEFVFMDYSIPGRGGPATAREIKLACADAKIIMTSSVGSQEEVIESVSAGAIDFVTKPFQVQRILNCVKRLAA